MVRILKVNGLDEKKRELRARSEIHRQTLRLEVANVKLGLTLLKKRMRVLKTVYRIFGWAVPIGGLIFGHKDKEGHRKTSFLSRLLSGFNLASGIKSMFGGGKTEQHEAAEAEDSPRYR